MPLGELPKGYNKAVHGPYDPAIFYGKKDVPLGTVKLQDVPSWLSRRSLSPTAMGQALSRAYWRSVSQLTFQFLILKYLFCRWNHKYCLPKYCGITPFVQVNQIF